MMAIRNMPMLTRTERSRLNPKTSQRKRRLRYNLEQITPPPNQLRKQLTQLDRAVNMLHQPLQAISAHHEPDLQRSKPPPKRNLPVAVVRDEAGIRLFVLVVRGRDRQSTRQIRAVLYVQH